MSKIIAWTLLTWLLAAGSTAYAQSIPAHYQTPRPERRDMIELYPQLMDYLGRWTGGGETIDIRWAALTPYDYGDQLRIIMSGPGNERTIALTYDYGTKRVLGNIAGYEKSYNRLVFDKTGFSIVFSAGGKRDDGRIRLALSGGKLTRSLDVPSPPDRAARPVRGAPGGVDSTIWYLARANRFERAKTAAVATPPDRSAIVPGLAMWPIDDDRSPPDVRAGKDVDALQTGYRYRTTLTKSPVEAFAFRVTPEQVTLATFGLDRNPEWIAVFRRVAGARLLPLISLTESPYRRAPVISGPLEVLPGGGWRVTVGGRQRAFAVTADRQVAVAQTLQYRSGTGWVDGPRERYVGKDYKSDWVAVAAADMKRAFADQRRDDRQDRIDKRRRQQDFADALQRGMANLPNAGRQGGAYSGGSAPSAQSIADATARLQSKRMTEDDRRRNAGGAAPARQARAVAAPSRPAASGHYIPTDAEIDAKVAADARSFQQQVDNGRAGAPSVGGSGNATLTVTDGRNPAITAAERQRVTDLNIQGDIARRKAVADAAAVDAENARIIAENKRKADARRKAGNCPLSANAKVTCM